MKPIISKPLALALASGLFALSGCLTGDKDKDDVAGGSVVENELGVGRLFYTNGDPAANAEVSVYSVNHIPGQVLNKGASTEVLEAKVRTDSNGRYRLSGLPKGEYNLLANKNGLVAYEDSVFLAPDPTPLSNDTLREPGQLSGQVILQPNHDPRNAIIQVLGTNNFTNVDTAGRFTLYKLGQGEYLLRVVVSNVPGYTTLYQTVQARSERNDTLPEPLRPIFTDLPVIEGVAADYDTAKGLAIIRWNKSQYRNLAGYAVWRGPAGSIQPTEKLNTRLITDTTFTDRLINPPTYVYQRQVFGSGIFPNDAVPYDSAPNLEGEAQQYWVSAINRAGISGDIYESATVEVVHPLAIATQIEIACLDCDRINTVSIKDTVRLVAKWKSLRRNHQRLRWGLQGADDTLRTKEVETAQGADTLVWVAPDTAFQGGVEFRILDTHGDEWAGVEHLSVIIDEPQVEVRADSQVTVNDTVTMAATAKDGYGRIVEQSWDDCGGKGILLRQGGTTRLITPAHSDTLTCTFTATDDDGNSISRQSVINTTPLLYLNSLPGFVRSLESRIIQVGGELLHFRQDGAVFGYTPSSDYWQRLPSGIPPILYPAMGKHFVIGTKIYFCQNDYGLGNLYYYDLSLKNWGFTARALKYGYYNASTDNGKIYFTPGSNQGDADNILRFEDIQVYDIQSDTWEYLPFDIPSNILEPAPFRYHSAVTRSAFFDGKLQILIHIIGQDAALMTYDPGSQEWKARSHPGGNTTYGSFFKTSGRLWISDRRTAYIQGSQQYDWSGRDLLVYGSNPYPGSANLRYFTPADSNLHSGEPIPMDAIVLDPISDPGDPDFLATLYRAWNPVLQSHGCSLLWYQGQSDTYQTFMYKHNFTSGTLFQGSFYLSSDDGHFAVFKRP